MCTAVRDKLRKVDCPSSIVKYEIEQYKNVTLKNYIAALPEHLLWTIRYVCDVGREFISALCAVLFADTRDIADAAREKLQEELLKIKDALLYF